MERMRFLRTAWLTGGLLLGLAGCHTRPPLDCHAGHVCPEDASPPPGGPAVDAGPMEARFPDAPAPDLRLTDAPIIDIRPPDLRLTDAPIVDVRPPDLRLTDAPLPDLRPNDAPPPDLRGPDAGPPDGNAVDVGPPDGNGVDATGDLAGADGSPPDGLPAADAGGVCGNGVLEPGEECDDGNTSDADSCSSTCQEQQVLQVAVGGVHTCAVLSGGRIKCWGQGNLLGLGDMSSRGDAPGEMGAALPAVDLGSGQIATAVTAGIGHTCALLVPGLIKCWGEGALGSLGLGDEQDRGDAPGEMGDKLFDVNMGAGNARLAVAVSAGYAHTCALLMGGDIKCWGANDVGQLGLGDTATRGAQQGQMGDALPVVDLGTGQTALAVSAGSASSTFYSHSCALLSDGSVKCWGSNSGGQLGLGDTAGRGGQPGQMGDALPAVDLGSGRTALSISAGYETTCALLDDHSVKCWGGGALGLGDDSSHGDRPGTMGDNLPAVDLGTGRTAIAVQAGYSSVCALLDNHSLKCWGANNDGQLGQGDTKSRGNLPGQMGDDLPAIDLGSGRQAVAVARGNAASAGDEHTCARLDDGSLKCWGLGDTLGLGDMLSRGGAPGQMGDNLPTVKLFSNVW